MNYERARNEFPLLLNYWGLLGTGVEVGVAKGEHAKNILDYWPGFLHLVDPWTHLPDYPEVYDHEKNYLECMENLKEHSGRFETHRQTSSEAVGAFKDGSLDFVYLDANHGYEAVKRDLEAWWPKVREGGMLAGDDYGVVEEQWVDFGHGRVRFGVKKAVDEWALKERKNISLDIYADWTNHLPGKIDVRARGWWCLK